MDFQSLSAANASTSARVETQTVHATHNAVKAEELSVFIGARCLLANAELKIAEQSHLVQVNTPAAGFKTVQSGTCYGLVGVNGCGKSTLLRLMAEGDLPVPPAWDVFLVSQHLPTMRGHSPIEEVLSADTKRAQVLGEQASLEDEVALLAEGDADRFQELNKRLLGLHGDLSKWDGAEKEVTQILLALGFQGSGHVGSLGSEPTVETPMNTLSGGWRMKVQLAKALWLQPKLLLLDEPTNHLDFQALQWLQEKLEHYPYTTVVVSHDVSFLHGICREILWMNELKLQSLPREAVSQEELLRMQRRRSLNFCFKTPESSDAENHGLSFHGVEFSHDSGSSSSSRSPDLQVKKDVRFSGGSRSVVLGKNGSGKSTFLDLCAGKLSPTRGNIDRTPGLKIGHYSQFTDELDQNSTDTAASYLVQKCSEELASRAGSTRVMRLQGALAARSDKQVDAHPTSAKAANQQKRLLEIARGVLSNFGFEGDVAVSVRVDHLSGGQKTLLKFAVLSLQPAHILFLDEPTNHLDAEASEALAKGLSEFKGGVVAVTHDELLIYRLIHCNWSASELLICRGGTLWRERNFGSHCLNALKSEVHRAEDAEGQLSKHSQPATEQPSSEDTKKTTAVTNKELPPWLQRKSRPREKKIEPVDMSAQQVSAENVDETSLTIGESTLLNSKAPASIQKMVLANQTPPLQEWVFSGMKSSRQGIAKPCISQPESAHLNCTDAPDTWEEFADSDASTDIPEGMQEMEELNTPPALDGDNRHCETQSCPQQESRQQHCEPKNESFDGAGLKDLPPKEGSHSRFRKDLVNLNKAVTKWIRQEQSGEISYSKIIDRIGDSRVAQHLSALHGQDFDKDRFVQDALKHAAKKEVQHL